MVRPGETLRVRGVLLDATTREPAAADATLSAAWEVADARGGTVARGWTPVVDGVLGAAWTLPAGLDGGRYTLKATFPSSGHPPAERDFDVRAFRAPTLKTAVAFLRDGYGPGDTVAASLAVENAEGGPPPAGTSVMAVARLDGAEVFRGPVPIANGRGRVAFDLPASIARGEGSLSFLVDAGGGVETTTRTLPILLQRFDLAFFPEGGVLAAGLPGRVYLEARTPWGDPADLVGRLVDAGTGEPIGAEGAGVEVSTTHEGRGVFAFTPVAGRTYSLKIVEPAGIDARFPLPAVEASAAVLRPMAERFDASEAVGFRLAVADPAAPLRVELASRERVVGVVAFAEGPGAATADVPLEPPADADGVLRATVFDGDGRPIVERLVFREPARKLRVEVVPGSASAVPGGEVELSVRTLDAATGEPVAAGVGITVTDDAELSVVQRRDAHPRLPAMALLESELVLSGGLKDPARTSAATRKPTRRSTCCWRRAAGGALRSSIPRPSWPSTGTRRGGCWGSGWSRRCVGFAGRRRSPARRCRWPPRRCRCSRRSRWSQKSRPPPHFPCPRRAKRRKPCSATGWFAATWTPRITPRAPPSSPSAPTPTRRRPAPPPTPPAATAPRPSSSPTACRPTPTAGPPSASTRAVASPASASSPTPSTPEELWVPPTRCSPRCCPSASRSRCPPR